MLLVLNILVGLLLSDFNPFNIAYTSVIVLLTGGTLFLLRIIPMKDAFVVSLSFLFIFLGLIGYVFGLLSPERIHNNGYILGTAAIFAMEGIIIAICSIVSKRIR